MLKGNVRAGLRELVHRADDALCRAWLLARGDRPGLLAVLFHAVSSEAGVEETDAVVAPGQTVSVRTLDRFIRYFLDHGYQFVSPSQISDGLFSSGRYIHLTFDDGYYNNHRALPVLQFHGVPATFFVSTNHVLHGRAYWWDVIHRERSRKGVSPHAIQREQESLKGMTHDRISRYVTEAFGSRAFEPCGDEDRPFTPEELRRFARDPLVHVGNHTADHAILTNYSREGVRRQLMEAQRTLEKWTGASPMIVSYPNGNYSPEVMSVSAECGLALGITVDGRPTPLPLTSSDRMRVGRFLVGRTDATVRSYRRFRSGGSVLRPLQIVRSRMQRAAPGER